MNKIRRPHLTLSKSPKREELIKLVAKIYWFFECCKPQRLTKQDTDKMADEFVSEKTKEFGNWQPTLKYFRTTWIPEQKVAIDALMPSSRAGGAHRGAGRKKGIETTVIRIPVDIKPQVNALIKKYKECLQQTH